MELIIAKLIDYCINMHLLLPSASKGNFMKEKCKRRCCIIFSAQ